ncbi:DUF1799 domain-containing protein [Aliihoeflea sp. PC F10.4]
MAADFAGFGVRVEVNEEAQDDFPVWPENWQSLLAFLDCSTQWRIVAGFGFAEESGLDYAGVNALLDRRFGNRPAGRRQASRIFEDIRTMEEAALKALIEVRNGPA